MPQVFVYGSLRKGMYNYELYLLGKSKFIGYGYVKGELYTLQGVNYPALLPGNDLILGEIYEINEECDKHLDELEGYQPNNENNDYHKIISEIQLQENAINIKLPVYFFNMNKPSNQTMLKDRISEGDYVAFMKNKTA